ncbi:MAG: site-specific integrase [Candidatus Scalinduaceae bacterium]
MTELSIISSFTNAKKHPREMGKTEIEAFLSRLATERNVSASTQRQVLDAIVFLYRHVLDLPVSEELEPVSRVGQALPANQN